MILYPYIFFTIPPFMTSVSRWVDSSMDLVARYTWTPLGLESTFLRDPFSVILPVIYRMNGQDNFYVFSRRFENFFLARTQSPRFPLEELCPET